MEKHWFAATPRKIPVSGDDVEDGDRKGGSRRAENDLIRYPLVDSAYANSTDRSLSLALLISVRTVLPRTGIHIIGYELAGRYLTRLSPPTLKPFLLKLLSQPLAAIF